MADLRIEEDILVDDEVQTASAEPEPKKPRRYRVLLLNDDYTPMDFVVKVLKFFFAMTEDMASLTMWQVHTTGKGECGSFTRDIAETKVALVNSYAREHDHPLLCVMEPEEL